MAPLFKTSSLLVLGYSSLGCQLFLAASAEDLVETSALLCEDTIDNDGDNLADCEDQDCAPFCGPGILPEIEPNDNANEADANALNDPSYNVTQTSRFAGSISVPGDRDFYRLLLSSDSIVRFETFDASGADCTGGISPALRFFQGATLVDFFSDGGINGCAGQAFFAPAGVYHLQVEDNNNDEPLAAYVVEIAVQPITVESEPNDEQATATVASGVDLALSGEIQPGALDVYQLQLATDGLSLRIEVVETPLQTCSSSPFSSSLVVLDSSGVPLLQTPEGGCTRIDGTGSTSQNPELKNLPQGEYFLQLSSDDAFNYHVSITIR